MPLIWCKFMLLHYSLYLLAHTRRERSTLHWGGKNGLLIWVSCAAASGSDMDKFNPYGHRGWFTVLHDVNSSAQNETHRSVGTSGEDDKRYILYKAPQRTSPLSTSHRNNIWMTDKWVRVPLVCKRGEFAVCWYPNPRWSTTFLKSLSGSNLQYVSVGPDGCS